MKKILILVSALCILASCSQTPSARISGVIEGASDTSVVLQKLNFNKLSAVDTIKVDAQGKFSSKVELTGSEPYFYYLYLGENQLAAMVLLNGDNINVKASTVGGYEISGSEESVLLQQVNAAYGKAFNTLSSLAREAVSAPDQEAVKAINAKLSRTFIDYRRDALKFVSEHPYSITSAVILFQKFNENLPVFGENADLLIFRKVKDSIETVYPRSEYVVAMRDEISAREAAFDFSNKLASVEATGFPDIALPDVNGEVRTLSSYKGNVIILSFWSVGMDNHKIFNNELVNLYEKYHSKGLEIYQVSLDIDKPSWAATVKSQELPWVSVNDGLGTSSPAVASYNLSGIPAMFVIDRNGDLAERDIYDGAQLEAKILRYLQK